MTGVETKIIDHNERGNDSIESDNDKIERIR